MDSYPEIRPDVGSEFKSFRFSTRSVPEARAELDGQIELLRSRIDKIVDKFPLGDYPIIQMILSMSHDHKELKGVAKGLDRVADLVKVLDELKARESVLGLVESDPNWFAYTFGDFSDDVDTVLNVLQQEEI